MQGLRRWMGSPHATNQLKGQSKSARKSETKRKQKTDDEFIEALHPQSTEYMAQQLMDPTVPEKEMKEYHGCAPFGTRIIKSLTAARADTPRIILLC